MKKVLSIVLSIAMVICLMPTMAFAATTTAKVDATYSDTEGLACEGAVNVLSALGVVSGYTDGTYKPEQIVTRAEMAKLIVTALGVSDYATSQKSSYIDMGAAEWAIPVVEYATNLGIINGYGYGKFGPNDQVTYEQVATMICRALGYTTDCKEMNGTYPAVFVQKARALGVLEDVQGYSLGTGANRGDVAIMLFNALDLPQVYADADGNTQTKKGESYTDTLADGSKVTRYKNVTMMNTLNKSGSQEYRVIDSSDVNDAALNIRPYLGAAAKVTLDKNNKVVAVGDLKTTFLTGELTADGKKIKVDGTEYKIENADYCDILSGTGGSTKTGIMVIQNGVTTKTDITTKFAVAVAGDVIDQPAASKPAITLAAKVDGNTVDEIYSVTEWKVSKDIKMTASNVAGINKNHKIANYTFEEDKSGNIDTASFILNGVSSLDDIAEDNIVYVYAQGDGTIRRVDVGTKTVTGEVTATATDYTKITLDGTKYDVANAYGVSSRSSDINDAKKVGDTVTVSLDYFGKIYDADYEDGSAGNYAVVMAVGDEPSDSAVASDSKIQLYTADKDKKFVVNGKKYTETSDQAINWVKDDSSDENSTGVAIGALVKYSLNDAGEIKKIQTLTTTAALRGVISTADLTSSVASAAGLTVTATAGSIKATSAGYFDGKLIADNALIISAPYRSGFDFTDADDLDVLTKAQILGSTINESAYIYDKDDKRIVMMIVDDGATSKNEYGIVTGESLGDDVNLASFFIGTDDSFKDKKVDGTNGTSSDTVATRAGFKLKSTDAGIFRISATTSDSYKLIAVTSAGITSGSSSDLVDAYYATGASISKKLLTLTGSAGRNAGISAGSSVEIGVADNCIVWVYDKSNDKWTVEDVTSICDDDDVQYVKAFVTNLSEDDDDDYKLVNYIYVYRN